MFKFIINTIFQQNKMHDSTLDLFCQHEDETIAEEFAMEIEMKAAVLEVTVDYYMMEFM
jgi:hypothetical protein